MANSELDGLATFHSERTTNRSGMRVLIVLILAVTFITAYSVLLRPRIPHGHESLTLAITWTSFIGDTKLPAFPAVPVIVSMILAIAVVLLPFRYIRTRVGWKNYPRRLRSALMHFLWVPGLLTLGTLLFVLGKEHLPKVVQALEKVLAVSLVWRIGKEFESTQRFGLDGVVGLLVGVYLWKRFGFRR